MASSVAYDLLSATAGALDVSDQVHHEIRRAVKIERHILSAQSGVNQAADRLFSFTASPEEELTKILEQDLAAATAECKEGSTSLAELQEQRAKMNEVRSELLSAADARVEVERAKARADVEAEKQKIDEEYSRRVAELAAQIQRT
jgi:LPS O-antigen subunit length determinant protein (WzzB/FepE family)